MTTRRTKEEWSRLLTRYRKSGYSQAAFCNRNSVSLATLQYHLKKDRAALSPPAEILPVGFVELAPSNLKGQVEIELSLPSGAILRVRG